MQYEEVFLEAFPVVGLSVRTTNQAGRSAAEISALWKRFYEQQVAAQVARQVTDDLYCVYTGYESDDTGWYTTLLGYRVTALDDIREPLTGLMVPACRYYLFRATGPLPAAVQQTWQHIWEARFRRKFAADFDVYPAAPLSTTVCTYLSIR